MRAEEQLDAMQPLHAAESLPSLEHRSASDEVLGLVAGAVASGNLSVGEARLIVLQRVHDVSTRELADEEGWRPCTIRQRRRLAEAALARVVA
jgi:DNA-directed RNA polymerase specialized sigma24 family protein